MSSPEPAKELSIRLARLRSLDAICDRFERDWQSGTRPSLEHYLASVSPEQRNELLAELLPLDIAFRRQRQETVTPQQYAALLSDFSESVLEVFHEQQSFEDTASRLGTQSGLPRIPAELPVGRFGGYDLLGEIARGGMGVVYKARQPSLDRIVAIKTILAGANASALYVERFLTEARLAARLHHPGIVPIYEVGQVDGQHFFTMEYVEGHTLAEFVERVDISPLRAAGLVAMVAEIVHFAHEQGVIHRDLKPSNVLIGEGDRVRVMDFGLAKRIEGNSPLTQAGEVLGTPGYMAPEQARGEWSKVDRRSDVYSLGALLYALLVGRPPHSGESPIATILAVLQTAPVAPRTIRPEIDKPLERMCLKCLAKDPAKRYGTARELAEDLNRYVHGARARSATVSTSSPATGRGARGVFWGALLLGGFLSAAAGLGVIFRFDTPDGTIVVEAADEAAKDLRIQATADGELRIADATSNWQISAKEGRYELQVAGGQDRFDVSPKQVLVTRGKVTRVKITKKDRDKKPEATRFLQPGAPDPTFGEDGLVQLSLGAGGGVNDAYAIALQPDGKIVTAGQVTRSRGTHYMAVARFHPDGSLDRSFNTTGKLILWFGAFDDGITGRNLLIQPDGKIVIGGRADVSAVRYDFGVARMSTEGKLDDAFGRRGIVTTNVTGAGSADLQALALQPDGKIVAAGNATLANGELSFAVVRYLPNGTLDSGFGRNGTSLTDFPGKLEEVTSLGVQADGKIVLVGRAAGNGGADVVVLRYKADGTPDDAFHGNGRVQLDFDDLHESGNMVGFQGREIIVQVSSEKPALVRLKDDGSVDKSFGENGDGRALPGFAMMGFVPTPEGTIIAANPQECQLAVFSPDGVRQTAYGPKHAATPASSAARPVLRDMVRAPDGKLVFGGTIATGNESFQWVVMRLLGPTSSDRIPTK